MDRQKGDESAIIVESTSADGQQDPQNRQQEKFIEVRYLFMFVACLTISQEDFKYRDF